MVRKYADNAPTSYYKITPSSIAAIRGTLGLPPAYHSSGATIEVEQHCSAWILPHVQTDHTSRTQQTTIVPGWERPSETTHLLDRELEDRAFDIRHNVGRHELQRRILARCEHLNERENHARWTPASRIPRRDGRDEDSFIHWISRLLPSWRRIRPWLPSHQTIATLVVMSVLLAASGGLAYGGYLVVKVIYTAIVGFCHGVAELGAKGAATILVTWRWVANIVRAFGSKVVKGERTIAAVVGKFVAAVKTLLGQH